MTVQPSLFTVAAPPCPPSIDLRCCDVAEVLASVRGGRLVHLDPPWVYANSGARGVAADEYALLSIEDIADHVDASWDCADTDARMALWCTWPQIGEWMATTIRRGRAWRWGLPITGGSWHKDGAPGVGFHWLGNSELILVYTKGSPPTNRSATILNAHNSPREAHSEKPTPWLRGMLSRWTSPGDLVLDLYAGLAPMARACALEGRSYVGAEIDPVRHRAALDRLAIAVSRGAA